MAAIVLSRLGEMLLVGNVDQGMAGQATENTTVKMLFGERSLASCYGRHSPTAVVI